MSAGADMSGALAGIRVLDLGHVVAGPFAGAMLGDFGAEVIKIEDPRRGDTIRALGPKHKESPIWWKVAGRNKKSVALDLRTEKGREILAGLAKTADVIVENFRPGTLERWNLGPEQLAETNPGLIVLRISGLGQGSRAPGFGRIGEAMSGVVNLTGETEGRPLHVGFSLGDATTGLMGAFGVLAALHARSQTGRGQVIDLALFEALFRMVEWQLPIADKLGEVIRRRGNVFPIGYAVGGAFQTSDGHWVSVSAATGDAITRMLELVGGDELMNDPDLAHFEGRSRAGNMERIDRRLSEWIGARTSAEVLEEMEAADLVAGSVYDAAMMLADPYFREREAIVEVDDTEVGRMTMPGVVPKLSENPGSVRWAGPRLGQHTREVLGQVLDLSADEVAGLHEAGVVLVDDVPGGDM